MKILLNCRTYLQNEVVISKSKQDGCSEWSVIHIKYPVISPLPAWERNDLTFEHFDGVQQLYGCHLLAVYLYVADSKCH